MIDTHAIVLSKLRYGRIFIVENRNYWIQCSSKCNIEQDLVLCVDFGLLHELRNKGYAVAFLDHLIKNEVLDFYNYQMHDFLQSWYLDERGNDLLNYKGFQIGDALLLNILNDVVYFCHFFFNIIAIRKLSYTELYVAVDDPVIKEVLHKAGLAYTVINPILAKSDYPIFSFPISKWMKEKIQRNSLKHRIKDILTGSVDFTFGILDKIFNSNKRRLFIQDYHPTSAIISELSKNKSIQLVFQNYRGAKGLISQRRVPLKRSSYFSQTDAMLLNFKNSTKREWKVDTYLLSDFLYEKLTPVVKQNLSPAISNIESICSYFDKYPIHLMVPITNLWLENRLIMNYCRNNKVPVFMIINGLLNTAFYRDGHDSDWVNCYSEAMKKNYFKNKCNALPLGDPRMDYYAKIEKKKINSVSPTILIGAAGFDPIDLNSYLAYEFDFAHDILSVIEDLRSQDFKSNIILKVRGNGYAHLYASFVQSYFPNMNIEILQDVPFKDVVLRADLYLTIYSQTIFEASSLGVPVIYYKKDTQTLDPPFDGKSELVTAFDVKDLMEKIKLFYSRSDVYAAFMDKQVLEKYIGPLDGYNLKRNKDFIEQLFNKKNK